MWALNQFLLLEQSPEGKAASHKFLVKSGPRAALVVANLLRQCTSGDSHHVELRKNALLGASLLCRGGAASVAALETAGFEALLATHLRSGAEAGGGAGGVGTIAIQLARAMFGASFVATTASAGPKVIGVRAATNLISSAWLLGRVKCPQ